MSFSNSCRRSSSPAAAAAVVVLVILVMQIWVCSDSCKAGAIRLFPENGMAKLENNNIDKNNVTTTAEKNVMMSKGERLRRFLNRKATATDLNETRSFGGLEDSKRRVPSCPDPLHN